MGEQHVLNMFVFQAVDYTVGDQKVHFISINGNTFQITDLVLKLMSQLS